MSPKSELRHLLKQRIAAIPEDQRSARSVAASTFLTHTPEFAAANIVMLFLSMADEIDTAPLALKCWQEGKTVVVPRVAWNQRRMMPVEITSLTSGITTVQPGVREPTGGKPVPVSEIQLVVVPGLGFSKLGYRIGRGMGFYDRFLAQPDFEGTSCGLAYEEQMVDDLPVLDHDMPLGMLVTDRGIRRFASQCIQQG